MSNSAQEPIFKNVFGSDWDALPTIFKKHYANMPYSDQVTTTHGTLDVLCRHPLKSIAPLLKLMGQIPPYNQRDVPVSVRFKSDLKSDALHFNRIFYFRESAPYIFNSRMIHTKENEVVEVMKFRLGWKMLYSWDGHKVILQRKGYVINIFGKFISLPLGIIVGKGYAEEIAVDDNTFDMMTCITHPLWGKIYEYKGRFTINGHS